MKRIRKNYSGVVPNGKVLNTKNNSLEDTYSCNYLNDNIPVINNMGHIVVDDVTCKNILPNDINSYTANGVTITRNEDDSLTLNGTATSTFNIVIFDNRHFILEPGGYTLSFHKVGTITGTALVSFYNQNGEPTFIRDINLATYNNVSANVSSKIDLKRYVIYVVNGCVFNNFTIYPQLEKGLIVTDYTPHKEFSNKQIYSTNEQVIGKWTDGKPLYRKTISIKTPSTTNNTEVYNFDTNFIIKNYYGFVTISESTQLLPINFYFTNEYNVATYITKNTGKINMKVGSNAYLNQQVTMTLEYTKTTD